MKTILKYFLCVLVVVVGFDLLLGFVAKRYVTTHILPGDYQAIDYLINRSNEECLIIGSSLAINSLMPSLMEDSLGMTCYNGGANAQSMPYFETMLDCVFRRYTPKMVIFVLDPNELSRKGLGQRYNVLVPYYGCGHELIDRNLESKDAVEPWLLRSASYRYNRIWWRILLYHFIGYSNKSDKGFVPHERPMSLPMLKTIQNEDTVQACVDSFVRCMTICNDRGVKVVCVFPPGYYSPVNGAFQSVNVVEEECLKINAVCIDDSQDSTFLEHPEWFYDNKHFNIDGSVIYTKQFLQELKAHSQTQQ
ncbi:MAG: hypothetical protein IJT30_09315 [Muribaculaceae bacterium]|nr:hypothetical protein [Muribaculaceae bacterium]